MPKYIVTFTKIESYTVEAENMNQAEDAAIEMLNADKMAFTHDEIDSIEVTSLFN